VIIKVLGPGCANCKSLERVTREAITELGLDATIEKVEDYATIASYGVMSTPALVVDERVVVSGRVPTASAVRGLLTAPAREARRALRGWLGLSVGDRLDDHGLADVQQGVVAGLGADAPPVAAAGRTPPARADRMGEPAVLDVHLVLGETAVRGQAGGHVLTVAQAPGRHARNPTIG